MCLDNRISICIPTRNRPALLAACLDSCVRQSYTEIEIVVGDDSDDDSSQQVIRRYAEHFPGRLLYLKNQPRLGQNRNVNSLFERANGDRLILLHDDDMLLPEAVEKMAAVWMNCPHLSAVFGRQYIANDRGEVLPFDSEQLNAGYYRTRENAGLQAVPAKAGIFRMFPNDGYMVLTTLARAIGYRPISEVGHACDVDFGLRVCLQAEAVWFLDEYVSIYRLTDQAISKDSNAAASAFAILEGAPIPSEAEPFREVALSELAGRAVPSFARLGQSRRALSLFFSRYYSNRRRLSLRGMYHLSLIARSAFEAPFQEILPSAPVRK